MNVMLQNEATMVYQEVVCICYDRTINEVDMGHPNTCFRQIWPLDFHLPWFDR